MKKTLTLLAAVAALVLAGTSMAPVAEAGGGVRLGFGFPLGSFTATPAGRHAGQQRRHDDYAARKQAARAAAAAEARREAAAARRAKILAAKAEARREALAEAAARRAKAARIAAARAEEAKKAEQTPELTVAPDTAPLPERAEAQPEVDVVVGQPKVVLSDAPAQSTGEEKKEDKVASTGDLVQPVDAEKRDCRKFVPSAGLTITVPCQ
ncbi:MAG: hypothetical protein AB7E80_08295 [Hyphomicrobiaceae bacterium]